MKLSKIIAVDFDGTIVENAYPKIGKPRLFAFETLKKLQNQGYRLTLWTYRSGKSLEEAVEFCKENGVEFYAVNNSFEGEEFDHEEQSRKINADIFVDDRNVGGFPGWGEVYDCITRRKTLDFDKAERKKRQRKKSFYFWF
ncbi:MAG: BT0820 family HAD-type phosphatase [Flavobacteriales bacterium]